MQLLDLPHDRIPAPDRAGRAFPIAARRRRSREYTFNTGVAQHTFCRVCGVKSFYVPRSNPDGIDINVHCLDRSTIEAIDITPFDDARRDESTAAIRHLSR